jgi:anti-sigma regulatory factor (Ser/Thr protein kinase)
MTEVHVEVGDHALYFYERESELISNVGAYVLEGIKNGEVAVLIATPGHREGITEELRGLGVDVAGARRDGLVSELDAATTLSSLMRDGSIDRDFFCDVIGQVMREAVGTGRPVRAYGEMVTLLWEAGDVLAVLELESLWNELQNELSFSLLCAYPNRSDPETELSDTLGEVCGLHSHVLGSVRPEPKHVTARFQPTIDAPSAARHLLIDTLTTWGHNGELLDDAAIVMSELAGNAVLHVGRPFCVSISDEGEYVRLSVRDPDAISPVAYRRGPTALSGRGMWLVDALACKWGVNVERDHKTVWADLPAPKPGE